MTRAVETASLFRGLQALFPGRGGRGLKPRFDGLILREHMCEVRDAPAQPDFLAASPRDFLSSAYT